VQYGRLVDIGRKVVDEQVGRGLGEKLVRTALKEGLTSSAFAPAMKVGQLVRGALPAKLKAKVPAPQPAGAWPVRQHARKMLLLEGCVQPAMAPNINTATARVLDALGVQLLRPAKAGCCGAIRHHLNDHDGGLDDARRNVDAWWPAIDADGGAGGGAGAEAIIINASGCGTQVKEYAHLLRHDPRYAAKAERVSALAKDVVEVLATEAPRLQTLTSHNAPRLRRLVFHPPCSLQHGQQIRGVVETLLKALGADLVPFGESHLCCGSAGTYSVLQPELSTQLRDRKLGQVQAVKPQAILSANIGCITHLASATDTPVMHWIEWVDQQLRH
jgi:glycolate oxidase iron-sulfur subunit